MNSPSYTGSVKYTSSWKFFNSFNSIWTICKSSASCGPISHFNIKIGYNLIIIHLTTPCQMFTESRNLSHPPPLKKISVSHMRDFFLSFFWGGGGTNLFFLCIGASSHLVSWDLVSPIRKIFFKSYLFLS